MSGFGLWVVCAGPGSWEEVVLCAGPGLCVVVCEGLGLCEEVECGLGFCVINSFV